MSNSINELSLIANIVTALAAISIPIVLFLFEKKKTERTKRREQTELIAELLATWARYPTSGTISQHLTSREEREFFSLLNSLSYKASIWVSKKELLVELQKTLTHKKGALTPKELVVKIREEIQGKKGEKIKPSDIVTFGRNLK
jgi:hypothetical protein